MITLSRKLVRTLRAVFRRAGDGSRHVQPPVLFEANATGLTVQCHSGRTVIAYHVPGAQPDARFAIALRDLAEFEGGRDQPVTLRQDGDSIRAEWTEAGIPQHRTFDAIDCTGLSAPVPAPDMVPLGADAFAELAEVAKCCGDDRLRYGLDCIQLKGRQGSAAGTDTRNLLITSGFPWPWQEDLLIPKTPVFASSELANAKPIHVGRTDDHVVFTAGPWTLWLPIEKTLRFPDVEAIVPDINFAPTKISFTPADRQFLQQTVGKLPHNDSQYLPVTVHVNGHMAVRGRGESGPVTELLLSNSPVQGEEVRVHTDRTFLLRAARLGLTQMGIWKNNSPVLAADDRHQYVWQPLCPELAIGPDPEAVTIRSPLATVINPPAVCKPRAVLARVPAQPRIAELAPKEAHVEDQAIDPLLGAEALRDKLRESLGQVNRVITSLKQQKRQQRFVRTLLARMPMREVA